MNKALLVCLLPLAGALLLACSGTEAQGEPAVMAAEGWRQGISVSGHGEVRGRPDVALLTLGVSAERQTVAEAREDAGAAMQAVIDAVKRNGVADNDIQTTEFRIEPQFDYRAGRPTLRGFRATNMVSIKVRDVDRAGDVVDGAVKAGGDLTQVQSLSFTIDDPTGLRNDARRKAMADARDKAEVLADAAGVSLGRPVSISETVSTPPPLMRYEAAPAAASDTGTPIEPGEMDVAVDVTVVYQLG